MSPTAKYNRRSIRLDGYDYTQAGGYFVTVCAAENQNVIVPDR